MNKKEPKCPKCGCLKWWEESNGYLICDECGYEWKPRTRKPELLLER